MIRLTKKLSMTICAIGLGAGLVGTPDLANAQDRYLGEIINNGFNFCPRGTAEAAGQLLSISQYTALFSLYGTYYGGDGRTTFGLPDLRGRVAVGQGAGAGLPNVNMGQKIGTETVVLNALNLSAHSHAVNANNLDGDKPGPGGKLLAAAPPNGAGSETIYSTQGATTQLKAEMISPTGNSAPVDIMDPFLAINYCVVMDGLFPSRQ